MKRKTKLPSREDLLQQMWALAEAKANDAVKLLFLPEERLDEVKRLDLAALSELKRGSNGTVELKFTDRLRALETLYRLLEDREEDKLDAFYQQLEQEEA